MTGALLLLTKSYHATSETLAGAITSATARLCLVAFCNYSIYLTNEPQL